MSVYTHICIWKGYQLILLNIPNNRKEIVISPFFYTSFQGRKEERLKHQSHLFAETISWLYPMTWLQDVRKVMFHEHYPLGKNWFGDIAVNSQIGGIWNIHMIDVFSSPSIRFSIQRSQQLYFVVYTLWSEKYGCMGTVAKWVMLKQNTKLMFWELCI